MKIGSSHILLKRRDKELKILGYGLMLRFVATIIIIGRYDMLSFSTEICRATGFVFVEVAYLLQSPV